MVTNYIALPDANDEIIEKLATQINSQWTKTVESILATAKLCFQARTSLSEKLRPILIKKLNFSGPTFSKLATIGENNGLHQPGVVELLPASFSTIYEVSQLSPERLQLAIESRVLNPKAKRSDIERFRKNEPEIARKVPDQRFVTVANILVPGDFTREKRADLIEALEDLYARFPDIRCDLQPDPHAAADSRWARKALARATHLAKKRVKAVLLKRFGKNPKGVTWKQWVEKKGFHWEDEVEITPSSDWEDIGRVYDTIGIGDEFGFLRDQAYNAFECPGMEEAESGPATDEEIKVVRQQIANRETRSARMRTPIMQLPISPDPISHSLN